MLKIWNLFWRLRNLSTLCRLTSGSTFCEFDWKVKGPVSTVFRASVSNARFLLRGRGNWQWCRVSVALHPSIQETHSYVFWLLQLFFFLQWKFRWLVFFFQSFPAAWCFFQHIWTGCFFQRSLPWTLQRFGSCPYIQGMQVNICFNARHSSIWQEANEISVALCFYL